MTTPEALKRRQYREGVVLILLAIFTVIQASYFAVDDRQTRECIADKFAELSNALEVRSQLVTQETGITKKIWLTYAEAVGALKDDPTKELPPKKQEELRIELINNLLEYKTVIDHIEQERRENPLPPYPVGTCED
jgi:hypothetical protein